MKYILLLAAIFTQNYSKSLVAPNEKFQEITEQVESAKKTVCKQLGMSEQEFRKFYDHNIKKFNSCFQEKTDYYIKHLNLKRYYPKNKILKDILEKHPNIKLYQGNNICCKLCSPAYNLNNVVVIDDNYLDKTSIILHELSHAIHQDCIYASMFESILNYKNFNNRKSIEDSINKYQVLFEKRADYFAANHGKIYSTELAEYFKTLLPGVKCNNHPPLEERILYLNNFN